MNILSSIQRASIGFLALISILASGLPLAAQEFDAGIKAEIWSIEKPDVESPRRALEILRSQPPKINPVMQTLDKLETPVLEQPSLVRVRGMLSAPEAFKCWISIKFRGRGAAELWIQEAETGAWKLIAWEGNPGATRIQMQVGQPQRFEFWTMGTGSASVAWRASKVEPDGQTKIIVDEIIAASHISSAPSANGRVIDDGLGEDWKRTRGLNLNSTDGPDGPWGDPDGDGLLNWKEKQIGSDPKISDATGQAGLAARLFHPPV